MRQRILIGIVLIVIGFAVCATGIGVHIDYLYKRYLHFAEHDYFSSFCAYYWAVGKGNLAVSVFLGLIPSCTGIYLLCKKPWWYKG